ncbi:MAG: hypothetical protein F4110_10460 [Acidimicrobiaceae bacterium]|nr:hypothetical protein [Acidimicrobiaceae bacterium]MYE77136.1 hypothetical protein [Acidimicrobiaceae bacterium]MYE98213.1 hypothetical protein [Acidimicrobiaceae bacterium]MYH44879.1 hypothetical protein [Acidimicrobiaceae bacterium]MYI54385.1 hypothetical protein [Acidimicrobiaceae bacterium]
MEVWIACSAHRHGIANDGILPAHRNAIRMVVTDEIAMLIGADRSGRLLETGTPVQAESVTIIHAMPARAKYLK